MQEKADQTRHGRGVGAAAYTDQWNAAMVGAREQMLNDGIACGMRAVGAMRQMGRQCGAGVHFNQRAALRRERLADVARNDIDTGDIEAHHACRKRRHGRDAGMHLRQHVDADLGVARQFDHLTAGGHDIESQTLATQSETHGREVFKVLDSNGHGGRLGLVGQLRQGDAQQAVHRVAAVACDADHFGASRGHHLVTDHQQAMLVTFDVFLDDDRRIDFVGGDERRTDRVGVTQIEKYRFATAGLTGLDRDWVADVLGRYYRSLGTAHQMAFRHRNAAGPN